MFGSKGEKVCLILGGASSGSKQAVLPLPHVHSTANPAKRTEFSIVNDSFTADYGHFPKRRRR